MSEWRRSATSGTLESDIIIFASSSSSSSDRVVVRVMMTKNAASTVGRSVMDDQ
jgi:hypothetical protein